MLLKSLYLFMFLIAFEGIYAQNKFTISGYISEKGSKESLHHLIRQPSANASSTLQKH